MALFHDILSWYFNLTELCIVLRLIECLSVCFDGIFSGCFFFFDWPDTEQMKGWTVSEAEKKINKRERDRLEMNHLDLLIEIVDLNVAWEVFELSCNVLLDWKQQS